MVFSSLQLLTNFFHVLDSNILPEFISSLTNFAPCEYICPQPIALWPTSLLPISLSLGIPTAVPWALINVWGKFASKLSKLGVFAFKNALP